MGTITEELFSRRLGHTVRAGDTVIADVDVAMAHDVTGPLAIEAFRSLDLPCGTRTESSSTSTMSCRPTRSRQPNCIA